MRQIRWLLAGVAITLALAPAACSDGNGSAGGGDDDGGSGSPGAGSGSGPGSSTPVGQITITSNAAFVTFQDGDTSNWVALTGVNGVYHAVPGRVDYAVAVACNVVSGAATTSLYYRTSFDPPALTSPCAVDPANTVPVTVQITGAPANSTTAIYVGDQLTQVTGSAVSAPLAVSKGTTDVFARIAGASTAMYRSTPIDLEQGQAIAIAAANAKPAETHDVTVTGTGNNDAVTIATYYQTSHLQVPWELLATAEPSTTPYTYSTIDASLRQPGDLTQITALTTRSTSSLKFSRQADIVAAAPAATALTIPAELTPPTTAPAIDQATDPRLTFTIPNVETGGLETDYQITASTTDTNGQSRTKVVSVSSRRAANLDPVQLTTPDLSAIPGWVTGMQLDPARPLNWRIQRTSHDPGVVLIDGYHSDESSLTNVL